MMLVCPKSNKNYKAITDKKITNSRGKHVIKHRRNGFVQWQGNTFISVDRVKRKNSGNVNCIIQFSINVDLR